MKKNLPLIALLLLVVTASSAPAAIQYEFRQTTSSDLDTIPSTDCAGRAIIDGDRSRIEFVTGNAYPPGTYLIATNGSRTMTFVDPSKKTFVEINAASVTSAIGARKITIGNKKIDVTKMTDQLSIAGFPTKGPIELELRGEGHRWRFVPRTSITEMLLTAAVPSPALGCAAGVLGSSGFFGSGVFGPPADVLATFLKV